MSKNDLGQIQVEMDTFPNGSLDLAHPIMRIIPSYELNMWSCPAQSVTLSFSTLYSGSASSSRSRGTANFSLSLNNPGSATNLISISIASGEDKQCPYRLTQTCFNV